MGTVALSRTVTVGPMCMKCVEMRAKYKVEARGNPPRRASADELRSEGNTCPRQFTSSSSKVRDISASAA